MRCTSSYGQRTEKKELVSAEQIGRLTGVREFLPLKMDLFRRIGGSALTDEKIAVPDAPVEESAIGTEIPVTYVPFRNAHFLSAAVSWAEVVGQRRSLSGPWSRIAPVIRIAGQRTITPSTS